LNPPKIVVVGSANTDMVVKVPHLLQPGETLLGSEFIMARGGKGANQAVAARRLGGNVTFIARLGQDNFGRDAAAAYREEGIDTSFIAWDDGAPSGVALIMVSQAAENIIAVVPGANGRLSPGDIRRAEGAILGADCMLLQLEIPQETVEAAVRLAKAHGVRVILNPAPAVRLPRSILGAVDVITPNEHEAAFLMETDFDPLAEKSISRLWQKIKVPALVVTLGARGACFTQGKRITTIPANQVQPVDTTAAGDAFNGALAVALGRGEGLESAVRFANVAGALSTTRLGAQPSLPAAAEVEGFLKRSGQGGEEALGG
jgi:ribokinase